MCLVAVPAETDGTENSALVTIKTDKKNSKENIYSCDYTDKAKP